MPTMSRWRRAIASHRCSRISVLAAAAMALLLAVAGSACSSSSKSGSATTTTTANAEAAVRQTVEGWSEAFTQAKTNPAGDHRELLRYGTADFVRKQQIYFDRLIRRGWSTARPADSKGMFEVRSVTINGSRASARTCSVDDLNVISTGSGAFVERQIATSEEIWMLERNGTAWLINNSNIQDVSAGIQPCPAS